MKCGQDYFCGLVVCVLVYRFRGLWFDSLLYCIFCEPVDLERGSFSHMRMIEEYLNEIVPAPVYKTEINGCRGPLR
jgi:hypothetical protein